MNPQPHPRPDDRKFDTQYAIFTETDEEVEADELPDLCVRYGKDYISGKFLCPGCEVQMTAGNREGGQAPNGRILTSHFRLMPGGKHRFGCDYHDRKKSGKPGEDGSRRTEIRPPDKIAFYLFSGDNRPAPRAQPDLMTRDELSEDIVNEDVRRNIVARVLRNACRYYATGSPAPGGPGKGHVATIAERKQHHLSLKGCRGHSYGTIFRHAHDPVGADPDSLYILYAEFSYAYPPRLEGDVLIIPLYIPDRFTKTPECPSLRLDLSAWPEDRREHLFKLMNKAVEASKACSGRPMTPWFFFVGRFPPGGGLPVIHPGHPASTFAMACDMPLELRRRTRHAFRPQPEPEPPEAAFPEPETDGPEKSGPETPGSEVPKPFEEPPLPKEQDAAADIPRETPDLWTKQTSGNARSPDTRRPEGSPRTGTPPMKRKGLIRRTWEQLSWERLFGRWL